MSLHKYRVKAGYSYGAHDEHKSGTIVVLDDADAQYEMDKLELAEVVIPGSADISEDKKKEGKTGGQPLATPPSEALFTEKSEEDTESREDKPLEPEKKPVRSSAKK